MPQRNRYPTIAIQSKNELAKRLSHKGFSQKQALKLINDAVFRFDKNWKDSKFQSKPEENKFVRSAKGTPLGILLKKINQQILQPHDALLPEFIFGGPTGRSHVQAAVHLLGKRRKRVLLKADISRFFEQVSQERVANFFQYKCGCSRRAGKLLSELCCVPYGPKGSKSTRHTLARGFATSSRLAVWCNLDLFIKLQWLVAQRLEGRNPKLAIYVDDIGITASRVSNEKMEALYREIKSLLEDDKKHPLPLNKTKKKIIQHTQRMEHLGSTLQRNRLTLSARTKSKLIRAEKKFGKEKDPIERAKAKLKYSSLKSHKRYLENAVRK